MGCFPHKHGVEHQTLCIDERTTGASYDIGEVGTAEQLPFAMKTMEEHYRGRQIQSLCKGRGRYGHLDDAVVEETLDFLSERTW